MIESQFFTNSVESDSLMSNQWQQTQDSPSKNILLNDGRVLEYYQFGDLNGTPVLYNHGMPGSAMEASVLSDVFKQHGLRIICPNRPGVGLSSSTSSYSLEQVTEDTIELLEQLNCTKVPVIGWSSGGVPSLWQAKYSQKRVSQVILLSSYSHFSEFDQAPQGSSGQASLLKYLTMSVPTLGQWAFAITGCIANYFPKLYYQLMVQQCHNHDADILTNHPQFGNTLLMAQQQTFTQSAASLFHDLVSQFKQWPFYLKSIQCPVTIFQGECDPFVPEQIGQHLADCLPNADYHLLPGQGHLYWLEKSFQYRLAKLCQTEPE